MGGGPQEGGGGGRPLPAVYSRSNTSYPIVLGLVWPPPYTSPHPLSCAKARGQGGGLAQGLSG